MKMKGWKRIIRGPFIQKWGERGIKGKNERGKRMKLKHINRLKLFSGKWVKFGVLYESE
jgi:hypothetical protein